MRVDARLDPGPEAAAQAAELEAAGYDGLWVREARHDPFVSLALACPATSRARLGTGVAIAFARTPMSLAYAANDLMLASGGRFVLGLGSQVRAHVERRFSMPWSHPADRMGEFVTAMRAIWHAWDTGERLRFEGEFYRHTLMPPAFAPDRNPYGQPPVFLAAVGTRMARTAGRVADGLLVHAFSTPRYLGQTTLPAFEEGLAAAGRSRADAAVSMPVFVATGETEEEFAAATAELRRQVAFYGSTPAYRAVLDLHGWGALADALHELSRRDDPRRWEWMAELVDDTVLAEFVVSGAPEEAGREVARRYAGLVDRLSLYTASGTGPATLARVTSGIRG
ncbi:putative F420-dependent oxidoreductase [Lipingzhangella halophila]|uniref:Putative F420-dependent oxidoreductase n=1 Tax=Lipingzhangella halophila TaxID=1783352 RepID=A0A7W7RN21_9ACTN|nr:TIGR03617 family F420-dependent LLM class oxidoreductase [Lipingzhangella halophila]MBB4934967.1 putative F420-dependent oxidoreductase [Lipingzhangella halophila]